MFHEINKPKFVESNQELDILKAKISHLNSEISSLSSIDRPKADLNYEDIKRILQNEISSIKDCLTFETERKEHLLSEQKRLSKYIAEEEDICKTINDYLASHGKHNDSSIMDERKELYFKLEILHRKVLSLIKKFSKHYFPVPSSNYHTNDLFLSGDGSDTEDIEEKKSLLDILSVLIIELGFERKVENSTGVLNVDDTVPQEYIEMLLCADIIERCKNEPSNVKLK